MPLPRGCRLPGWNWCLKSTMSWPSRPDHSGGMADGRGSPRPPVGPEDFRVLDPAGYYLRITDRAR